jgi:flagellar motor protein MotB
LIEVVGHTDEQPLAGLSSNLDQHIYSVLTRSEAIELLKPGDNAGLGLARAIAVTRVLAVQSKLKAATVLPYSAAQLIVPGDRISSGLTGNIESRRRIEIRVRRRTVAN